MSVRRAIAIALACCLLLVSGCTAAGGCGTPIPDVKGKTPAQAEEALLGAGFKLGAVTYDEYADGAAGAVVEQDPEAGTQSPEGTIVNLTVAGAAPTLVPPLAGLTADAASSALMASGLLLGDVTHEFSDTVAAGEVISQQPAADSEVEGDTSIDIVVSKGPEPATPPADTPGSAKVTVPAVKGLKLSIAQSKLEAAGLKWQHDLGPGDGMTDVGFVYKQVPVAGTEVDAGSVVTIVTWKGP